MRRELRARSRESAAKALFLTNGGSAAALLALLQAVWSFDNANLIYCVILALGLMAASLPLIIWIHFNEVQISLASDAQRRVGEEGFVDLNHIDVLEKRRIWLVCVVIGLFMGGLVVVCFGAGLNAPAKDQKIPEPAASISVPENPAATD